MKLLKWYQEKEIDMLMTGMKRAEFDALRKEINETNRQNLTIFSTFAAVMLTLLFAATFFSEPIKENRYVYLSFALLTYVILYYSFSQSEKHPEYMYLAVYGFSCILFSFGIILGTYNSRGELAANMLVLLVAFPLLFILKPVSVSLILILADVVFLVVGFQVKDADVMYLDMVNVMAYGILSIIICGYTMRIKIKKLAYEADIRRLSERDQLTGLQNRRSFKLYLESIAEQYPAKALTIIALDVNGLKKINDTRGHLAGDNLICGAAACILQAYQDLGEIYRVGGDEFIVLIVDKDCTDAYLRGRMTEQIRKWNLESRENLSLSIACGIAKSSENTEELPIIRLLSLADERMYDEKKNAIK